METPTIPGRIHPKSLDNYLEIITRAVFQAGLSWAFIAERWAKFREAFCDFDVARVAAFTEADFDRLSGMDGIVHSNRKIRATIKNAQTILELDRSHGGFKKYLRSFQSYEALSTDLRKRFKFLGEMSVWYVLFRVREPVPDFETWIKRIPGDHPRMREMVELANTEDGPRFLSPSKG
ncbi:MAG: DNA-3-methyladenine glycosylase I [Candidatus Eremiobacteraeota bacterium]|nr:DNA-3-methyladenine glycosylase I [Candidatus Eremiobacteraeota bacterium]